MDTPSQWLELLKAVAVAFGLYLAIRVDLARLQIKVEHHDKEIARIDRALEK